MTYRRVALLGFVAGTSLGAGLMAAAVARAAYAITAGNRWYQIKQL
jgi:hypothetical protein